MADEQVCEVEGCDRAVKARGLCNPHYQRSKRRYDRAGRPDDWGWTAGVTPDFTQRPGKGGGGVRGSPPPAEHPGETETAAAPPRELPSLRQAIDTALEQLPAAVQTGWRAAAVRLLAETLDEARWEENAQPSAAGIRELWARMTALEEAHAEQEHDAFDRVADQLAELLAQAQDPQPSAV